jgi:hypothetical protein
MCVCVFVRVCVLPGTGPVTAVAITTAAVAYPSTTTVNQLPGGALFTADRKVGKGAERCERHLNQIGGRTLLGCCAARLSLEVLDIAPAPRRGIPSATL